MTDKQPQQGGTLVPSAAMVTSALEAPWPGEPGRTIGSFLPAESAPDMMFAALAAAHEHYAAQVAAMAQPQGDAAMPLTDDELADIAYRGFDSYWTEGCRGIDKEAWAACAKAVLSHAQAAIAARDAEIERLRSVLRFYAHGNHMILADENAWDTVSGEEENWWCDEAGTATIEDGSFAVGVLTGKPLDWGDDGPPTPLAEEKVGAASSKTPITREWCIAAAQAELTSESDPTIGAGPAPEAAQPAVMVNMVPPATARDRWMHLRAGGLVQRVEARKMEAAPLTREFFASLMRRGTEQLQRAAADLVRDETERARKSVRQQVIDRVADSTRAHHELKAKVEKFEAETGIPLSGYGAPPTNVIALAKKLQVLAGWSGDNPVGRLEQIAGDLDRVAEQLRKAAVDTGLRD